MSYKSFLLFSILKFVQCLCEVDNEYVFYPNVNVSYKLHKTPVIWNNARLKCIEEDAVLAMPKNAAEAKTLKEILDGFPGSSLPGVPYPDFIFLRFHDIFAENEYVTDEGYPIQYFYHTWKGDQPDNRNDEDCGSMHRSGYLNDYGCTVIAIFICQKEENPHLNDIINLHINLDPAYMLEPHSNKRFKLHTNIKTWDQARTICLSEGGQLANIESKQEEDFLVNMMNDPDNKISYSVHKDYALLGFHDHFAEGVFVTVTGKPLNSLRYARWYSGEPNNAGKGENCGSMHSSGALNDFPCSVPCRFFCEIKATNLIDVRTDMQN